MEEINITIDSEPYVIKDIPSDEVTVKYLLVLGQKPESRLEDYELFKVMNRDDSQ